MKHKKKAKAVAPAQALFDEMEGEASSDASSDHRSAAEVLAETDAVLEEAEAAEFAAVAPVLVEREESAILGRSSNYINVDAPLPQAEERVDEATGAQEEEHVADVPSEEGAPVNKNRTTMENVALVFLEDAFARRLAVAWEVCGGNEEDWFDAAGVTSQQRQQARQVGRALRLHGICRDGGVTDKVALEYIRAVIARPLTAAAKKKP
jgi:hypothetical protein